MRVTTRTTLAFIAGLLSGVCIADSLPWPLLIIPMTLFIMSEFGVKPND